MAQVVPINDEPQVEQTMMQITVPAGVEPGQVMRVNLPNGSYVDVAVPEGAVSGSSFQFIPPTATPTAAPTAAPTFKSTVPSAIPIPQMEELQRDDNVFDEKNDPKIGHLVVNILCWLGLAGVIATLLYLFSASTSTFTSTSSASTSTTTTTATAKSTTTTSTTTTVLDFPVESEEEKIVLYVALTLFGFLVLVYFMNNIVFTCEEHSKIMKYLRNQNTSAETGKKLSAMQSCSPTLMMKVECYHHEFRKYNAGDGKKKTRRVRVVTHRAEKEIKYTSWRDVSTRVTGLGTHGVVRVSVEKDYTYADPETFQYIESTRLNFRWQNDTDKCQDYSEELKLNVWEPAILCIPSGFEKPSCMSATYYYLISALGANWCFRNFVERNTTKTKVYIRKQLSINQIPQGLPPHVDMNKEVQYAMVYRQMYGRMAPNLAPQVVQAMPDVSTLPVAIGYSYTSPASESTLSEDVQALGSGPSVGADVRVTL